MTNEPNSINLQAGDIVQLKSGGQKMTLESIQGTRFKCKYWDEIKKEFKTLDGEIVVLEKIDPVI